MKYIYTIIAMLTFGMSMLFAQDVTAPVAEGEEILFANQFLATISSVLLSALTVGLAWVGAKVKKYLVKWGLEQEVIDQLGTQVSLMWHDEVRELKISLGDGKISKEDALDFRRRTRMRAQDLLTGPAKDLLIQKGKDWASAKIEDIISSKKSGT